MHSGRVFRSLAGSGAVLAVGAALLLGLAAPVVAEIQSPAPPAQGAAVNAKGLKFSFGLWGDMPYAKSGDDPKIPALIRDMNGEKLAFSAFDGDIKDGSSRCDNAVYAAAIARFNSLVAPLVYVPGDNEWTDCHRTNNGGFNNLERLDYIRQTMFGSADSFGQKHLTLEHQGPVGGLYVENTRWTYSDVVFVGLNVPGSNNNKVNSDAECTSKSARTLDDCAADNQEYQARDQANIAWMHDSFQLAKQQGAVAVMLIIQADPSFDLPETDANERTLPAFDGYTNFLNALTQETQGFQGQVVLVHGDTHFFKLDKPLIDQAHLIENFTRLETFGSPNIHWVKVDVDPRTADVFTFTPMLVPGN
jgi:hypothetical protein